MEVRSIVCRGIVAGLAAGWGGAVPPANDSVFTKDELSNQPDEIGSTDSQRDSLISNLADNLDEADNDSDGKVSFKEAMAFDQLQPTNVLAKVMLQIMQLVRACMGGDQAVPPSMSGTA